MNQARVTQECFSAILKLQEPELTLADMELAYAHLRLHLDRLLQQPATLNIAAQEAQDIAYAVIALADEVALRASGALAQFWAPRLLQMHYFNETVAGEGFFLRLEALQRKPEGKAALQTYYAALALGFQGRYGVHGSSQEIAAIMTSLRQALVGSLAVRINRLSPAERTIETCRPPPGPDLFNLKGIAAAVAMWAMLYAGMALYAGHAAQRLGTVLLGSGLAR